jgi:hypothetical protein
VFASAAEFVMVMPLAAENAMCESATDSVMLPPMALFATLMPSATSVT